LEVAPASSADESAADALASRALAGGDVTPTLRRRARRLYRTWDPPGPHECDDIGDKKLKKVVVDQEPTQFVTLHWSDGSLETAGCSSGKGHCCTTTADGVACDHARSRTDNSNCTPISHGAEFSITDRLRVFNGWNFWNTFVPTRGIALHEHNI